MVNIVTARSFGCGTSLQASVDAKRERLSRRRCIRKVVASYTTAGDLQHG